MCALIDTVDFRIDYYRTCLELLNAIIHFINILDPLQARYRYLIDMPYLEISMQRLSYVKCMGCRVVRNQFQVQRFPNSNFQ